MRKVVGTAGDRRRRRRRDHGLHRHHHRHRRVALSPEGVAVDADRHASTSPTPAGAASAGCVGTAVTQVAFTGTNSSTGDDGPAVGATIRTPSMLTVLADGDLLVSDRATNSGSNDVRRIELS